MIKYIFFDMDGVIADTEPVHFISDVETFLDCWVEVEKEILTKFVSTFAWIAFWKVAKKVFEKYWNPKNFSSKKAFSKKDKFFEKNLKKINPKLSKWLPDFFTFLKEKWIKIWLISSSKKFEVDSILKHFKIENLFERWTLILILDWQMTF